MAKILGVTFAQEVMAAGCGNAIASFVVGADDSNLQWASTATVEDQAAVQVVIDAHDPTKHNPDVSGFKQALFGIYLGDRIAVNDLNSKYPYFRDALDAPDWDGVKIVIEKALERTDITPQVYAAIKATLPTFYIPVSLA